jgi:uroporphyrin-III C-methyltransferase
MTNPGFVYIVGAGPGDPELITVRGLKRLQQADVVVYDRLANPQLLHEAPSLAEQIDVGKAPGRHTMTQTEINTVLVQEARQGKAVVRLKGGDPFVFGRGGEECLALVEAGIPFEVVPGISSALAVPAYAGIPVTQRGMAQSFTVVTGHSSGASGFAIDWQALPQTGTLVILMGVRHLAQIVQALQTHGRAADTPVAVIQQGTTAAQKIATGTLADIAQRAKNIVSPAIIIIGEVVNLQQQLTWFQPLNIEINYHLAADR